MKQANDIALLIFKHLRNDLSPEESRQLHNWLAESGKNRQFFEEKTQPGYLFTEARERDQMDEAINLDNTWQKLMAERSPSPVHSIRIISRFRKYAATGILIFMSVLGVYLWQWRGDRQAQTATNQPQPVSNDVQPANGNAVLVLDNGKQIILDSINSGLVATEAGKQIMKNEGRISYQGQGDKIVYNTLFTNKGKTTSLLLADGSRVWLNAESSIRFPTAFPGNNRIVEITGQAYFEVAKNRNKPFRVQIKKTSGQACQIEVLGTHFDVSAYADENEIKATLLEGAITVTMDNAKKLLAPGQQAAVDDKGNITVLKDVDTDAVMAWKDRNFFFFKNDDLQTIMRQLGRWYNVQVEFETNLPGRTFSGQINRTMNLSDVLTMLGRTNIHYTIENNVVTIHP